MKIIIAVIGLCIVLSASLQAQTVITGVVTDTSHKPIPYASVYLSQTTFGVITNDKGAYTLNIPQNGTYELISSCIGYESYSHIIKANGTPKVINIELPKRTIMIKEVTVKEKDKNRPQNYKQFVYSFMGHSANAQYCKIENPKDLIVYRDSQDSNLIAYSIKPLIITNSALEYKILYDLKYFRHNFHDNHLRFLGDYYFQDISNQKRVISRTNRNRLLAYYGSRMHFLRTLFSDSLSQHNFQICNIERDSCGEREVTHLLKEEDLRLALSTDSMTLYHFNPILIYYTDQNQDNSMRDIDFRPITYVSRIDFYDKLQVYKDGYYPDAYNISWSGAMGRKRIAELLPYDYIPGPLKKARPKKNK